MAKLELDAQNIFELDLTVKQIRDCVYDEVIENKLDEAQGHVLQNLDNVAYVVIKVTL